MDAAIAYIRVSSDEQVAGTSLGTQLRDVTRFCDEKGWRLLQTFSEEGESAKTASRPRLRDALIYASEHKPRWFVVWKLDRLSRNQNDHHAIVATLAKHGTSLQSVTEGIGDDPSGRLLSGILAALAEHDNSIRAQRTRRGLVARAERGAWTTIPPLGYIPHRLPNGDPSLLPCPERAQAITAAFKMVAGGSSQVEALDALTAAGVRSMRAAKPLTSQAMSKMLRAPVYKGVLETNLLPAPVPGNWPPLVTPGTWAQAQATLKGYTRRRSDLDDRLPLRGLLLCGACRHPLTGGESRGRGGRYLYYNCRKCRGMNIRAEQAQDAVLDFLDGISIHPAALDVWVDMANEHMDAARQDASRELAAARRRVSALQTKLDGLVQMRANGEIDADTFQRNKGRLDVDLIAAQAGLEDITGCDQDIAAALERHRGLLTNPRHEWTVADRDMRAQMARLIWIDGPELVPDNDKPPTKVGGSTFSIWGGRCDLVRTPDMLIWLARCA